MTFARLKTRADASAIITSRLIACEIGEQSGDPATANSARATAELLSVLDFILNIDPKTGEPAPVAFNPETDTVKSPVTGADLRGVKNAVSGGWDFSEPDPKTGRPVYFNVDDKGAATL